MKLYGLKTCDTCRKAIKAMPDASFHDVRDEGVPFDVMERALQEFRAALVNTRSTTWRNLSNAEREKDPKTLLAEYPTLMKRPLVVEGDQLFLGWSKATQEALGL